MTDFSKTINLPKTVFAMKANLSETENLRTEFWKEKKVYQTLKKKSQNEKKYILHDGPPYANGHLKKRMYLHPKIRTMTIKAKRIVSDLYDLYNKEPDLLPKQWINFKNDEQKHVIVSDYISGMTDKYAINIHKKFFDLYNF